MTEMTERHAFSRRSVAGDDRDRLVCDSCGWIHYENPKIVVGSVVIAEEGGVEKFLLCRRAIEPRRGYWTIPAGFLEEREAAEAGARREAVEEAKAAIEITALLGVYSIPRISQVQLIYLARLPALDFAPGTESLEAMLFPWERIPWDELAFPSVHWALHHYQKIKGQAVFQPFVNPQGDQGDRWPHP